MSSEQAFGVQLGQLEMVALGQPLCVPEHSGYLVSETLYFHLVDLLNCDIGLCPTLWSCLEKTLSCHTSL